MSAPDFDEPTQERASLHALGLLAPDEAAAFEREIWTRKGLRELVDEFRQALETVARAEAVTPPPPRLRETLLEELATRPASKPPIPFAAISREPIALPDAPRARSGWIPWSIAAGLAVAAGVGFVGYRDVRTQLDGALANAKATESQLLAVQTQNLASAKRIAELENDGGRLRADNSKLAAAQAQTLSKLRVASLVKTPSANPASPAAAMVVWDTEQGSGLLAVKNLPPAPAGKDYQLWVIDNGQPKPISGGVFKTASDGSVQIRFNVPDGKPRGDQFAISLERAGGRPSAEGPVFLAGASGT